MTLKNVAGMKASLSEISYIGVYRDGSFRVALAGLGEGDEVNFKAVLGCLEGSRVERVERVCKAKECARDKSLSGSFTKAAQLRYFEVGLHEFMLPADFQVKVFSVIPEL